MAVLPPAIHTYHCICTSLLLASTHTLSSLPRRQPPSLDNAFIIPIPNEPPSFTPEPESEDEEEEEGNAEDTPMPDTDSTAKAKVTAAIEAKPMPAEGYTLLVGMAPDKKIAIIRREEGFEKRLLHRCSRCRLVVGYEIHGQEGDEQGLGFQGKVVYLLPNGCLETGAMVNGIDGMGKRVGEADVGIESGERGVGVGVWE